MKEVSIISSNYWQEREQYISTKFHPSPLHCPCHVLCNSVNQVITAGLLYNQGAGSIPEVSTLVTFLETKHWCLWQGGRAELPTLKWVAHSVMAIRWQWLGMDCLFITKDSGTQQDRQQVQWGRTSNADKGFANQTFTSQYRRNKSLSKLRIKLPFITTHHLKIQQSAFWCKTSLQAHFLLKGFCWFLHFESDVFFRNN